MYTRIQNIACVVVSTCILISVPAFSTGVLQSMTDSVNSGIINSKMYTDNQLDNTNVDATVENGIAIYRGQVNSQSQVDELVRIAHSISGIKGVDTSNLHVRK